MKSNKNVKCENGEIQNKHTNDQTPCLLEDMGMMKASKRASIASYLGVCLHKY